jgi:RNA polymerase sigma factor (TIGR02999 family)
MEPGQPVHDVTRILEAIQGGCLKGADELFPIVYDELRRLAAQKLSDEKPGQTLQATALVHEAYIRLVGSEDPGWENRVHFFSAAAQAMRRLLVGRARQKRRLKRAAGMQRVELDGPELASNGPSEDLVALDEALDRLSAQDRMAADVVKLRCFAGLSNEEAGEALRVSVLTVKRQAKEADASSRLDEQRWGLLGEARALMATGEYSAALEGLQKVAAVRHDDVTQLLL